MYHNKKKFAFLLIIIITIALVYHFFIKKDDYLEIDSESNIEVLNAKDSNVIEEANKENKIVVHITGEVLNPGVYELKEHSRITDAVSKAGGLTNEADLKEINLAYFLEDGMKIYIPKIGEDESNIEDTSEYNTKESKNFSNTDILPDSVKTSNEKININTATQAELELLPGIGPSTALKIVEYRKKNGKFATIEEIKSINGIGDGKFQKIKDLIKV